MTRRRTPQTFPSASSGRGRLRSWNSGGHHDHRHLGCAVAAGGAGGAGSGPGCSAPTTSSNSPWPATASPRQRPRNFPTRGNTIFGTRTAGRELTLPHIEQQAVFDGYWTLPQRGYGTSYPGPNGPIGDDARLRQVADDPSACGVVPATLLHRQRIVHRVVWVYRASYRGCVGSGDMYGNAVDATSGPWGRGVFSVKSGQSFDSEPDSAGDVARGISWTALRTRYCSPRAWWGRRRSTAVGRPDRRNGLRKHGRLDVLGGADAQFPSPIG